MGCRIFVVAGNKRQFDDWCRESCISPRSPIVTYIGENQSNKLWCTNNPWVIFYGTWSYRSDIQEIMDEVNSRQRGYREIKIPTKGCFVCKLIQRTKNWRKK